MKLILTSILVFGIAYHAFSQNLENLTNQKPVSFSGSINSSMEFYSTSDTNSLRSPFSYMFAGNFNLGFYGISMPFSVLYSNQNFNYAQPFNRVGFSPEYKWIKLHLGYRSVTHSSLTLAGHTFLGAGVELDPGKFRFSYVYGRFKKKTIPNSINPLDSLISPTRKGYSLRIGYGSEKNHLDFIFLKIMDDTLSRDESFSEHAFQPAQGNTVAGTQFRFALGRHIDWETEGALSILTNDLNPMNTIEIEDETLKKISNLIDINETTEYSSALRSSLQYTSDRFNFGFQYRRIDPNYQSFGAYYFNTDMENITANTTLRLFNKKLLLRGNVGVQNDDLKHNKGRKSKRFISRLDFDYNTGKVFAISGNYSNYSINQFSGRLPLNDTIKLYQSNRSMSVTPRLNFISNEVTQSVIFNYTNMDLLDHNRFTAKNNQVHSTMAVLNYVRNYQSIGLNISVGLNRSVLSTALEERTLTGYSIGAGKFLFDHKLNFRFTLSRNSNKSSIESEELSGWVRSKVLSAYYRPFKRHTLRTNMYFTNVNYPTPTRDYTRKESKIIFGYAYTF